MQLFGHPLSSCTRKVLFTAAEKGAPLEVTMVDLMVGAHKQPAHLARHPFGVVPVLDDDGFLVYESRAIARYLDARLPGPALTPPSARDRARMDQWMSVDASYIAPHTRALAVQRILRKHARQPIDEAAVADAEAALRRAFEVIDGALAGQRWLAGDVFSLADISLAPYLAALPMIGAAHASAELRNLGDWWTRVSARPAWQRLTA
jgi:glutathione S-transferase